MNKGKTIVLGLGNPLMGDEGIGVRIIEEMTTACGKYQQAVFVDAGTGGLKIIYHLEGYDKAIIIDCAVMGCEAGSIRCFTPEEVKSIKQLAHQSLHEADILHVIEIAKSLGNCPEKIVFFGIEPESVEPRMGLSETLEKKLNEYIEVITRELA